MDPAPTVVRVVFWGGPWHDRAVDIAEPLPSTFFVAGESPMAARVYPGTAPRTVPFAYWMMRCADPGRAVGGPTIARRIGSPPTWPVYVAANATEADMGRWNREASRPVVDGPRSALRVLVDRDTRRQDRVRAEARVRRRGPLP